MEENSFMASKKNPVASESSLVDIERNTKKAIADAPKVTVFIAPDEQDPMWRGCINGVDYKFPKGELIEVPEPLAFLIENSTRMQRIKAKEEKMLEGHINLGSL